MLNSRHDLNDVDDQELEREDLTDLYNTYSDFFTLPLLDPDKFSAEVLIDPAIKQIIKGFDDVIDDMAEADYYESRSDPIPAGKFYILNKSSDLKIKYLEAIVGPSYLTEQKKGGLAKHDTQLLEDFFIENKNAWKYIYLNTMQLETAAKSWYLQHGQAILNRNVMYREKAKRRLKRAAREANYEFSSKEDFNQFKEYISKRLDNLETAMSKKAFKQAVKKCVSQNTLLHKAYQVKKQSVIPHAEGQSFFSNSKSKRREIDLTETTKVKKAKTNSYI